MLTCVYYLELKSHIYIAHFVTARYVRQVRGILTSLVALRAQEWGVESEATSANAQNGNCEDHPVRAWIVASHVTEAVTNVLFRLPLFHVKALYVPTKAQVSLWTWKMSRDAHPYCWNPW